MDSFNALMFASSKFKKYIYFEVWAAPPSGCPFAALSISEVIDFPTPKSVSYTNCFIYQNTIFLFAKLARFSRMSRAFMMCVWDYIMCVLYVDWAEIFLHVIGVKQLVQVQRAVAWGRRSPAFFQAPFLRTELLKTLCVEKTDVNNNSM